MPSAAGKHKDRAQKNYSQALCLLISALNSTIGPGSGPGSGPLHRLKHFPGFESAPRKLSHSLHIRAPACGRTRSAAENESIAQPGTPDLFTHPPF